MILFIGCSLMRENIPNRDEGYSNFHFYYILFFAHANFFILIIKFVV
jgi:hypothetical protein